MVKLNRIYTRTGDNGTTGLGDGVRVRKDALRVAAYGTVDEANAAIGLAVRECGGPDRPPLIADLAGVLARVQNDLFDVGADLCCPLDEAEKAAPTGSKPSRLRVTPGQTRSLEDAIDRFNAPLPPLNSFVLPGGSALACALHLARTVTRRAERDCVALMTSEPDTTSPETVRYLNRLSDLLFVLARAANSDGPGDVLWVPGAGR